MQNLVRKYNIHYIVLNIVSAIGFFGGYMVSQFAVYHTRLCILYTYNEGGEEKN